MYWCAHKTATLTSFQHTVPQGLVKASKKLQILQFCNFEYQMFFSITRIISSHSRNPTIYNIIHWFAGSLGQMTRRPSVWCSKYIFFHDFLQNSLQKWFQCIFSFLYEFTKIKTKSFECPKSIRNCEKNNTWNIGRLVNESFVPATQQTTISYCRLSYFWSEQFW